MRPPRRYFLRAATFSRVCTVALFKQQEAFHGTSSRKPIRINPAHDGLPTHHRMHIKCKCRALHSRSAASGIRGDSQIIFNAGARKSTLQLFFPSFVPHPVAPKGRPYLNPICAGWQIYGADGTGGSISCRRLVVITPRARARAAAFWLPFQKAVIPITALGFPLTGAGTRFGSRAHGRK